MRASVRAPAARSGLPLHCVFLKLALSAGLAWRLRACLSQESGAYRSECVAAVGWLQCCARTVEQAGRRVRLVPTGDERVEGFEAAWRYCDDVMICCYRLGLSRQHHGGRMAVSKEHACLHRDPRLSNH